MVKKFFLKQESFWARQHHREGNLLEVPTLHLHLEMSVGHSDGVSLAYSISFGPCAENSFDHKWAKLKARVALDDMGLTQVVQVSRFNLPP